MLRVLRRDVELTEKIRYLVDQSIGPEHFVLAVYEQVLQGGVESHNIDNLESIRCMKI